MNSGFFFRKSFLFLLILLLLSSKNYSQNFVLSDSFGKFKDATSFVITSAGFIYVTDAGTNEIYKLDTLGNVLKYAGGYGWDDGLFDNPSDIFANPLSVYVCDKNNHRIERFDKDLNFIWQLSTRNSDTTNQRFGYPMGCAVSQQGDLYVLDSENKRIVKFDLFGNFVQNFGGYDAGNYSLINPKKITISSGNNVFIADDKRLVEFDQFGNGISILKLDTEIIGMNITFNQLTINNEKQIFFANLNLPDISFRKIELPTDFNPPDVVSSLIFNDRLYVLTKNSIKVLTKVN